MRVGIVAPSSRVPQVELELGAEKLRAAGFEVRVHPQCRKRHLFFAGTDEERAGALYDYAMDPEIDVLWTARGGSGAIRILPILHRLARERGRPAAGKLLVGYSDATLVHEYVRRNWGWATLHGAVPGLREFSLLDPTELKATVAWARGERPTRPGWKASQLKFSGPRLSAPVEAELVGGNLTIWATLMGTPYAPSAQGRILFFEDVTEYLFRLDRVAHQILLSGGFEGAKAIVLGNFLSCHDSVPGALKARPREAQLARALKHPRPAELKPLRPKLNEKKIIPGIFEEIGEKLGIPVARGLPIGHGPGHAPLPLGAVYRLGPKVGLELVSWSWLRA